MNSGKKIFGAFALSIALFFVWPGIVGSWQEMSALRVALAERQQLHEERTIILNNAMTAYEKYQSILGSTSGRLFSALVPVKKDSAELVSALQDMAVTTGIQLNEIRMSDALRDTNAANDTYKTMTLTMDMSGSYPSLRAFLSSLEQYVRVLNVQNIDVSAATLQQTGILKFTVTAQTYFIK